MKKQEESAAQVAARHLLACQEAGIPVSKETKEAALKAAGKKDSLRMRGYSSEDAELYVRFS